MSISRNSEEMHKQSTFFHENFIRIKLNELRDEKLIKDFKILEDCEDNFIIYTLEEDEFHIEYLHDNQFTIHVFPENFHMTFKENLFITLENLLSFISPSYEKTVMSSLFERLQSGDI